MQNSNNLRSPGLSSGFFRLSHAMILTTAKKIPSATINLKDQKVAATGGRCSLGHSLSPLYTASASPCATQLKSLGIPINCTEFRSFASSGITNRYIGAPGVDSQTASEAAALLGWALTISLPWKSPMTSSAMEKITARVTAILKDLLKKGTFWRRSKW